MAQTKLLTIRPHLSYEQLTSEYRACKKPPEKSRLQLIWLMSKPDKPMLVKPAAQAVGFCERWARQLVHRYNQNGLKGLIDKRKDNLGQEPILNSRQTTKLRYAILNQRPSDGGLWTSPKIADWIWKETGKRPNDRTGLNYLQKLGFSLQQPRTSHTNRASAEEIKRFKKN